MSFKINLYTFAKDSNSTKQPTGTGTQFDCNILTPADITAPVCELTASDLTAYNYAYIAAFHRYYFIEGITYDRGLWLLSLKCDVLATYKTTIGAQSLYVLRSAAASDGTVQDNLYPPLASVTRRHAEQAVSGIPGYAKKVDDADYRFYGFDGGYIVLNVAGTETAGATSLILMTTWDFRRLIGALYTAIDGFQLADVVKNICQKFGGNPQELINGALWMPWPFNGDDYLQVKIGGWLAEDYSDPDNPSTPVPIYGLYIDDPVHEMTDITFTINKHPQAATRGAYLNMSPYTSYILGVPGCGVITLDSAKLLNESTITLKRVIDAFTGQYNVNVYATSSGQVLAHLTGQIGVPISLRGSNNATNVVGDIVSTVGNVVSGNVIGAAGSYIGTVMDMAAGTPTSSGMGGGFAEILGKPIWLDTLHYAVSSEDNTHNGRPLLDTRTISTLSGFIQVQKGDVPISGTSAEADEIRSLLEGGFYYE